MRRAKSDQSHTAGDEEMPLKQEEASTNRVAPSIGQQHADQQLLQETGMNMSTPAVPANRQQDPQIAQPDPVSGATLNTLGGSNQQRKCEQSSRFKR